MKKSKFAEWQIAYALHLAKVGTPVVEVFRRMDLTKQSFYRWKRGSPLNPYLTLGQAVSWPWWVGIGLSEGEYCKYDLGRYLSCSPKGR